MKYAGYDSLDELFSAMEDYRLDVNPEFDNEFYHSLHQFYQTNGKLSEKQIAILVKIAIHERVNI